jgi:hypothetical protein
MKPFLLFLILAALGNVAYHIGQKTLSPAGNPMVLLMGVHPVQRISFACEIDSA